MEFTGPLLAGEPFTSALGTMVMPNLSQQVRL
jgi:hypothetical protein